MVKRFQLQKNEFLEKLKVGCHFNSVKLAISKMRLAGLNKWTIQKNKKDLQCPYDQILDMQLFLHFHTH